MTGQQPVCIAEYDRSWPQRFKEEEKLLREVIASFCSGSVEHIGSTAVEGLAAKPVIDIMVGVESLDASRPAIPILERVGYCYFPYRPTQMHWFCKPSPAIRTHHVHLVPFGNQLWVERIAFRDYLRAHSEVAREYGMLKRRLAQEFRLDREAYTDAKSSFVMAIVSLALASGDPSTRGI
jgi:GrpB-like predicted nucleotidyltransferase (UPF0157 family)